MKIKIKDLLLIAFILPVALNAQAVSNLKASFIDCKAVINFDFTTAGSKELTLMYSGDDSATWLPCVSVSGDTGNQNSGNKTIIWDCTADGINYGIVEFRVDFPSALVCDSYSVMNNGKTAIFRMMCVYGGSFTMGCTPEQGSDCNSDEYPSHQVTLSDFSIAETEVTCGLWFAVMGSYTPLSNRGDNYPAVIVRWNDIVGTDVSAAGYTINGVTYYQDGFCYKLSQLIGNGLQFRLPTEAEWEYAARGGSVTTKQTKYSGSDSIGDVAYLGHLRGDEVATKQANLLGLYDMSGNALEWCSDRYGSYSGVNEIDPVGPGSGYDRVLRGGGGKFLNAEDCRVSSRYSLSPDNRIICGFRLACSSK